MKLKNSFASLVLILLVSLIGCYGEPIPDGDIIHKHDSAVREMGGKSLNLKIINFKWRYLHQTDQIEVSGQVKNLTGKDLQGCRIIADGFDQFDTLLGTAETFIVPTYLAADKEGHFEFYYNRGKWVKNIRLKYRFETRY